MGNEDKYPGCVPRNKHFLRPSGIQSPLLLLVSPLLGVLLTFIYPPLHKQKQSHSLPLTMRLALILAVHPLGPNLRFGTTRPISTGDCHPPTVFATVWGPGRPTGKLPRRLDRTRRQFLLRPVLGHFRTAGLSKDHGAPQGETLLCRPNKRTTEDGSGLQIP